MAELYKIKDNKYKLKDKLGLVKRHITHQGIGGKECIIEFEVSNEEVIHKAHTGNFACCNFIKRRPDFDLKFNLRLYYVKVDNLGYILSEDEFKLKGFGLWKK